VLAFFRCHDGLTQIAIVVGSFEVYQAIRNFIHPDWPAAFTNAKRVFELERVLHFAWEQSLQNVFLQVPEVVRAMNIFYFVGHFVLTGAFFLWLYLRSREGFKSFRNAFLVATTIAIFIHWQFPTAPPRLVHELGIGDTLRMLSNIDIGSQTTPSYTNPVAAVPSLHAGWAVGVAVGIFRYSRSRALKTLGALYPVAVILTIVVTGNHFLVDAVAGMLVMAIGFLVARGLTRGGQEKPNKEELARCYNH
jgi:membrane-associated phospholipid phosphatase